MAYGAAQHNDCAAIGDVSIVIRYHIVIRLAAPRIVAILHPRMVHAAVNCAVRYRYKYSAAGLGRCIVPYSSRKNVPQLHNSRLRECLVMV